MKPTKCDLDKSTELFKDFVEDRPVDLYEKEGEGRVHRRVLG